MTQEAPETELLAAPEPSARPLPWWAFCISLVLTALPILSSSWVPSWDYSMHATRASIIVRQSLPLFRDAFHHKLVPLPNLAVDVLVPLLSTVMPINVANRLFVLLALLLQATGAAALGVAVQGRLTAIALLIPVACYNLTLGWGFTGYLFSMGLALWGFAIYVMQRDRSVPIRAATFGVLSITTYFGHLAAFGIMVVSVLLFEVVGYLQPGEREKHGMRTGLIVVALSCIVPAAVHVFLSPVNQSIGTTLSSPAQWTTDLRTVINPYRTVFLSFLTLGVVGMLCTLFARRIISLNPWLGWTALFLLIVFVLTPFQVYGSWYTNTRLVPWVAFVFLASTRLNVAGARTAWGVGGLCTAVLCLQTGHILSLWHKWDAGRTELLAAADQAPPGTMFITIEESLKLKEHRPFLDLLQDIVIPNDKYWQPPTSHITDEVAMDREYLPMQLTLIPGKQPTELDPKYLNLSLRVNSSFLNSIAPVNEAEFNAASAAERRQIYSDMIYGPLVLNMRTSRGVREVLRSADEEYRAIRRASGIYPSAGTYVVYIHHWSNVTNPFPVLLREVHSGALYNVYEVRPTAALPAISQKSHG